MMSVLIDEHETSAVEDVSVPEDGPGVESGACDGGAPPAVQATERIARRAAVTGDAAGAKILFKMPTL